MRNKKLFSDEELSLSRRDPYEIASATYTVYTEMEKQMALYEKYLGAFHKDPTATTLESNALIAKDKIQLYHRLKERGIFLLIENTGLRTYGYHYCLGEGMLRDYYEFGGYGFHSDGWYGVENFGNYNNDSYLNKKESMSLERAEQLLDYRKDENDVIEEKINELNSFIGTLSNNQKKKIMEKAIQDGNYTLQYILLDDPIQEIYDLIEMSSESQLEG